ncbi:MAG: hypothetical protein IKY89_05695 [Alistipes sp.]|nr:hypothetical protein [Alistipes sp.]
MQEIKDSGQRSEFPTGFVRDMHEGKGRFDLLPWGAIWELAKHCENGAAKYGERNIDKGAPQHSLIDSAIRHLAKYLMGHTDENHLRAAMWNVAWALEQDTYKPEMQDIPARLALQKPVTIDEMLQKLDEAWTKAFGPPAEPEKPTPEETERIEEGEKILEEAEQSSIVAVPLDCGRMKPAIRHIYEGTKKTLESLKPEALKGATIKGTIKGPLELIICEHMACPENADGACRKGHTTQCAGYIDPQIFD